MAPKKIMFLDIDDTIFGKDEYDNDKCKIVFKELPDFLKKTKESGVVLVALTSRRDREGQREGLIKQLTEVGVDSSVFSELKFFPDRLRA